MTDNVGRNVPCPCGSGKKYKRCCLKQDTAAHRADQEPDRSGQSRIDPPQRFLYKRAALVLLFFAVIIFLLYSNTLGSPFLFDDVPNIEENHSIRLTKLTLGGIAEAGFKSVSSSRPVANISFALNYYFHQYDVTGYHVVNILIHIITGILVYFFIQATLRIPILRARYGHYKWMPLFSAVIWLVHPVQTQSVSYIVQRMNSMAALFYVLSFYLYVKARVAEGNRKKWMLFAGCIISGILALGCKEIAATLPLFIFLYEWYFFQDMKRAWLKRYVFYWGGMLILLGVIGLIYLGGHPFERIMSSYQTRDFTMAERVLTEFRVVIYYMSLLIFPHPSRLNLEHDFTVSHSLIDPLTTLCSLVAIIGLTVLAGYIAKKERLVSFCMLWFLGNLVIESSVFGLEILFEHRMYLPSMLFILMAVALAYRYIKIQWLRAGLLCIMVTVFSFWTYSRNTVWSDDVALWKDCVKKSPKKARPYNNLGNALISRGKHHEAITNYSKAVQVDPDYAEAHYNLGIALSGQGKYQEAMNHYFEAVRISPDHAEAHYNLGNALTHQARNKEAIRHYSEAARIKPDYLKAHNNLGNALASQGNVKEAVEHYFEVLRIDPDYADAHYNLGNALIRQGKLNKAMEHYYKALKSKPDFAEVHNNLGIILQKQGKLKEAVSHYSEAVRIKPGYEDAHQNLKRASELVR